jgi:guanylate kinase
MDEKDKPLLIVISAPSGAGKSTLCDWLLAAHPGIAYSVSCTTRAPRGGEVDGVHYHFLTPDAFERRVQAGAFLEHAKVHGNRYGTLMLTVRQAMQQGKSLLMDIDVQGARQVRAALASLPPTDLMVNGFVDIFVHPPSLEELRRRLEGRGEDAAAVIEQRLANAATELADAGLYRYQLVNDDLGRAQRELAAIIRKEQCA